MKLYTYDHCPYCVRVRFALGVKGIAFEHEVLLNDDEETPIGLIGAKIVPIFEKDNGEIMGESLDIVRYLDQLQGEPVFGVAKDRAALGAWISEHAMLMRELLFPRWVNAPIPEFATASARAYFTGKKTEMIGDFQTQLDRTPELKARMEAALVDLAALVQSSDGVHGSMTIDDVDLFGRLRGVTLIKDLEIPDNVRAYIDRMAALGNIPLYDAMAVQ